MDINEFHIMFKRESPVFDSKVLGEIVGKVLQDEKVPNSGTPTLVEQPVSKTSQIKKRIQRRDQVFYVQQRVFCQATLLSMRVHYKGV